MREKKTITYGPAKGESIEVESLTDELRFVECMKLYKTHGTLEEIENALTTEAKERIRLTD